MQRYELTDEHFKRLWPFLPTRKRRRTPGRLLPRDQRRVPGRIQRRPWRDLPQRYGPWQTAHRRLYAWRERRRLGARKNGEQAHGMTRGGSGSKAHLVVEAGGLPVAFVVTKGNRNECPEFVGLFEKAVAATGRLPQGLGADRGYSADFVRRHLAGRGVEAVIPMRRTEHVHDRPRLNEHAYRGRNVIERCVGKLKNMCPIVSRFEKFAGGYEAMLTLACIVLYLRRLP